MGNIRKTDTINLYIRFPDTPKLLIQITNSAILFISKLLYKTPITFSNHAGSLGCG